MKFYSTETTVVLVPETFQISTTNVNSLLFNLEVKPDSEHTYRYELRLTRGNRANDYRWFQFFYMITGHIDTFLLENLMIKNIGASQYKVFIGGTSFLFSVSKDQRLILRTVLTQGHLSIETEEIRSVLNNQVDSGEE